MRTCLVFALTLATHGSSIMLASTNAPAAPTNILAIHLVVDEIPHGALIAGPAAPDGRSLMAQPILSDPDFVAWDETHHTFVMTPTAAKRVAARCSQRRVPFVLFSRGEPVHLGMFGTLVSSSSAAVPVRLTDLIVKDCFMELTNVPVNVLHLISRTDPGVTERVLVMTNATTNVVL